MEELLVIVGFVLALVLLAILSMWIGPDNRKPLDPWTIP